MANPCLGREGADEWLPIRNNWIEGILYTFHMSLNKLDTILILSTLTFQKHATNII